MLTPGDYTVEEAGAITQTGTFLLRQSRTFDLIAAGDAIVNGVYSTLVFSNVSLRATGTCISGTPSPTFTPSITPTDIPVTPASVPSNTPLPPPTATFTPLPTATQTPQPTRYFPVTPATPTLEITAVAQAVWMPVAVGGAECPDWLAYHTNRTGDWEIFRLGDLPDGVQADPNLSRGVGKDVIDVMPSRSPDKKWITFASNRDGNWEIYISAVEQSLIRRITYSDAIERDPVWSPTGADIIYDSNRDGDWNLYRFNVSTGAETRLTESPANDVNAFWSPDGQRIVFESDHDGRWQIYELTLATLQQRRLSDGHGDDHDPQYANDGQKIAFRSLRDGKNSVIYWMQADGSGVTRVSDPAGEARNHAWSPDSKLLAYQSDLDGDNDIYVYEVATQLTRLVTDNPIEDYAPTWYCNAPILVFTSDITGDPNLFRTPALPMTAPAILVDKQAAQLTFDPADDVYPLDSPSEEDASRRQWTSLSTGYAKATH